MSEKPEKPLHVQVAEVLGWRDMHTVNHASEWWGRIPGQKRGSNWTGCPPRYDTDWSATGPLLDSYRIDLRDLVHGRVEASTAWPDGTVTVSAYAGSRQQAVCNLILALRAAGKLPKL